MDVVPSLKSETMPMNLEVRNQDGHHAKLRWKLHQPCIQ